MTGICYFSNKSTDFLAEQQVDAVVRYTEDDCVTLRMEGEFSPEKADALLNEAIINDCDNVVFITDDARVDLLEELIPQEYGKYFENITVLQENFERMQENDTAANNAQTTVQNEKEPTQPQAGDKIVFICDAAAPDANLLNAFLQKRKAFLNAAIQQAGLVNPKQECWFANVDSSGLCASNIKKLYQVHPNNAVKEMIKNANFTDEGFDSKVEDLVMMAENSKTVQAGHKYCFVVPKKYGTVQSDSVSIIPFDTDFENPNNNKIIEYIMQLAKLLQDKNGDIKQRSDLPKNEDELSKQMSKDRAKIEYIQVYVKAFEWWSKNRDKRIKTKEAESQFEKALKEFVFADAKNAFDSLENGTYGKGAQFLAKSAKSMVQGVLNDYKADDKAEKDDKAAKQEETDIKKIFAWEHYNDLCKVLNIA